MSFWKELKRRNIYKVGVAYAIVAWLIIQAAAIVSPALQLPKWTLPFVIVILCICFPLILLFAWAFEITPDGIKRTRQVPLAESITPLTGQKLNYIVTGLLVLAVGFLAVKVFFLEQRAIEPEVVSTETEQATVVKDVEERPNTIAVLPFVDISPEKDQEYFVDGLSEELLNTLAQIPDLTVIARTSSFSFKGTTKKVQEIANELGVDNILEGSVRKSGDALRITAQLVKGVDGSHLWSKTYDRELKDIFEVQEDIATAVADELKITLGVGKSLKQLVGTENVEAYELYLIAQGQHNDGKYDMALESINSAIALDSDFALAWASKASQLLQRAVGVLPNLANEMQDAALQATLKAIELDPNLAEAYVALGKYRLVKGDFIEVESAIRKALELKKEALWGLGSSFSLYYLAVGQFERAFEIMDATKKNDPLNLNNQAVYMFYPSLFGDMQRVEEEYERGIELFGWDQFVLADSVLSYARLASGKSISRDNLVCSDPICNAAKEHLDSPKEGLVELSRLYNDNENLSAMDFSAIFRWAAYFGDPEFALESFEKGFGMDATMLYELWFPVMHEVRQLHRFKEFIREIGLVDYWNKFGWPDICHQLENGDFECD